MSQCIQCKSVIAGEPHYEHIDEETGEKWQWCSMVCLMLDAEMTDCEICGIPVVREDAMQVDLYRLQGSDPMSCETMHFCSTLCMDRVRR